MNDPKNVAASERKATGRLLEQEPEPQPEIQQEPDLQEDETPTPEATGENSSALAGPEQPTEGTDGEEEEISSGKLDAEEVNRIVKARIEKVRAKTRQEVEAERQAEIEFWQERARGTRAQAPSFELPPKPVLSDYASNPPQFEKDLEAWAAQKSAIEAQQAQLVGAYVQRCRDYAKVQSDFDKTVAFYDNVDVPKALELAIYNSPNGPQVAYHLAKNFKEFNRISRIQDPVALVYELAKVELEITGVTKIAPQPKPAPRPMRTVQGGGAPKPVKTIQELADAGDKGGLLAARKKAHQSTGWERI